MSESVLSTVIVPINRAGWPFIGGFAVAAAGLFFLAEPLGWIGVVLTLWCAYFFRDPERVTPARQGLIISPADGVVQSIGPAPPPPELDMGVAPLIRVCVFMNVFNVHVNRVPVDGTIARLAYRPGRFLNASLDKASEHNERQGIVVDAAGGFQLAVVQIAGTRCPPNRLLAEGGPEGEGRRAVGHDPVRKPGRCLSTRRRRPAGLRGAAKRRRRNRAGGRSRPGTGARSNGGLRTPRWKHPASA